jgi:hypothetical protein
VLEEAGSVFELVVSVLGEVRNEFVASKAASLGKTVHAFSYFNVDVAVVCDVGEVVGFDDVHWESREEDLHVLVAAHWRVEIKIFDVESHEHGVHFGKDAVEENLGSS